MPDRRSDANTIQCIMCLWIETYGNVWRPIHTERVYVRRASRVDGRRRACTSIYAEMEHMGKGLRVTHQARLHPLTDVNALKIKQGRFWARLRPSTDEHALGVNAQAFSHVFHIGVDARLRPSTDVDMLGVNGPWLCVDWLVCCVLCFVP